MRQARYVLIDDIDKSPAAETLHFSVGKQQYEIDLSDEHLAEFHKDMERWISHARKVARRGRGGVSGVAGDAAVIRAWAQEQGIPMSSRGRISAALRDRYYRESGQSN